MLKYIFFKESAHMPFSVISNFQDMFDGTLVEMAQAHHLELVQYTESFLGPFNQAYAMEAIMGDNNWMIRYNFLLITKTNKSNSSYYSEIKTTRSQMNQSKNFVCCSSLLLNFSN